MKTVISVKVDKEVKESAQEVAASAGISLSSLINAYLRQLSATRRIEFYAPESMTPKLEKELAEIDKEIEAGDIVGPFKSIDGLLEELKKPD